MHGVIHIGSNHSTMYSCFTISTTYLGRKSHHIKLLAVYGLNFYLVMEFTAEISKTSLGNFAAAI